MSKCRSGAGQRQDRGALLRVQRGQGLQVVQDGWSLGFGERIQDGGNVGVRGPILLLTAVESAVVCGVACASVVVFVTYGTLQGIG